MARPMVRMTYSTKYAWPALEPAKRDLRPGRDGRFSRRITMSTAMPRIVITPMNSMYSSNGRNSPIQGSVQSAWNSWPNACARVGGSVRKPMATNQWAKPTMPQRFIRVWPRNSRTRVTLRA